MLKKSILAIGCFGVLVFVGCNIFCQSVFAETILTISVSNDDLELTLLPGEFGEASQTVTVNTNNPAGYSVNISPSGNSSSLINEDDSTKTIPTFTLPTGTEWIPVASIGDGFGYSLDNGDNYTSVPAPSNHKQLYKTTVAGQNNYDLTFGVKVPTETVGGVYTNSFVLQVVANLDPCQPLHICYYGNGDDGEGTMPDQPASSNTDINLIPSNFSRPGYGFAGWNTAIDGTGITYGPNESINPGDLSTEGLQLYAKWVASAGDLQNWRGCSTLQTNQVTALTDTRDGSTYAIAKLPDDKCWMIESLRLDLSDDDLILDGSNTNHPLAAFADEINQNHPDPSNSFCTGENANCINQILYNMNNTNRNLTASYNANNNSSSWYSYGHYYNWYTLTTGYGTYELSARGATVNGDICPAGWKLPSGNGTAGDLSILDVSLGGSGINQTTGTAEGYAGSKRWRKYPINIIYGGEQKGAAAANRAISCSFGTVNAYSAPRTMNLWVKEDGLYMNTNNTSKVRGQTVRCVAKEGYNAYGNIHYVANGGSGTMADATNVNLGTETAATNQFTRNLWDFYSWNTSADGSGITVAEGGTVSAAAEHMHITDGGTLTLYAIWSKHYSLTYDGNGADAGSMTAADLPSLTTGSLRLIASNYSRANYGFVGWSLDANAADKLASGTPVDIYGPNETVTVNNAFLSHADPTTNNITLYAVWIPKDTTYTMQTFGTSECTAMSVGEVKALTDTRNNDTYAITKLADNHCWMIENLRLMPATTTFDSTNTNLPTAAFVSAAPTSASSNSLCNQTTSACIDQIQLNANAIDRALPATYENTTANTSWYSYGIMYNWFTASAGNGDYAMASGNVAGDICPARWRLPTGGNSGEYVALNNLINANANGTDTGLREFPANFIYSGDYNHEQKGGWNSYGRFWSATPNGTNEAFRLGVATTGATPAGAWGKWDAFAVRCIVK